MSFATLPWIVVKDSVELTTAGSRRMNMEWVPQEGLWTPINRTRLSIGSDFGCLSLDLFQNCPFQLVCNLILIVPSSVATIASLLNRFKSTWLAQSAHCHRNECRWKEGQGRVNRKVSNRDPFDGRKINKSRKTVLNLRSAQEQQAHLGTLTLALFAFVPTGSSVFVRRFSRPRPSIAPTASALTWPSFHETETSGSQTYGWGPSLSLPRTLVTQSTIPTTTTTNAITNANPRSHSQKHKDGNQWAITNELKLPPADQFEIQPFDFRAEQEPTKQM